MMQTYTLAGAAAILLWSTTVAFSRELTESLGTLTTAACTYLLAGGLAMFFMWRKPERWQALSLLPRRYLWGCGALFVLYIVVLYLAIGSARERSQVVAVGLINYLWPALSLVFAVPLLGKLARPWLPLGLALASAGTWLAAFSAGGLALPAALADASAYLPYLGALVAAVAWGLYSNLSRRWNSQGAAGGVPLFLLASGVILFVLRLMVQESSAWSPRTVGILLYMAIFPALIAYSLWDASMRRGDVIVVMALSYLTPLLSTLISMLVLSVSPSHGWWLAAALVVIGAAVCRGGVQDTPGMHSYQSSPSSPK